MATLNPEQSGGYNNSGGNTKNSKKKKSNKHVKDATAADKAEFYNKSLDLLKYGMWYDPLTGKRKKALNESGMLDDAGRRKYQANNKLMKFILSLDSEQRAALDQARKDFTTRLNSQQKRREFYRNIRRDAPEEVVSGDGESKGESKAGGESKTGGESKVEDTSAGESKSGESKSADDDVEMTDVPGADAGDNVMLTVQEAAVDDGEGGEDDIGDGPNPIFDPANTNPPPPVPDFHPGAPVPAVPANPVMPPVPDGGPNPMPAVDAIPVAPVVPVAPEAPPAMAGPAPPAPPAPPPGPPPGPPAPPNPDEPDGAAGPADPQLVEVNRGVPGEGSGQMGFTSSAAARVAGERNRMRYSRDRLINEIRAFVRIYRDQIKTRSFVRLAKIASRLTKNSPAIRLRQVHRQLEEEIIDFYRSASGMRLGVILDPSAIGLNVNQLQSALAPNLTFQGQGEVVRNLARAADAGTPNDPVQRAVDTHYHLGGLAHATRAVLPEGRNLQSNDRPAERIQLLRGRTRKMRVPQEATRRYLWRDTRRPIIPKNIKIKSVRD